MAGKSFLALGCDTKSLSRLKELNFPPKSEIMVIGVNYSILFKVKLQLSALLNTSFPTDL